MIRILSTIVILASTYAYRQDLAKLPNGQSYGLTLGHPGGNTKVPTKLASTFYAAGQQWTKAFCMADADGDGQTNGLEMGDPCCKWSVGQTPQFTTGLSDPNSATSTTLNKMPPCIMTFANAKLQCAVCVQALQLDMAKPSDNAAEFSLTSVKACKDATQDDEQKILCVAALIKNADQLLMDQKNGVAPLQSCMNLGLVCMAPPKPTQAPTSSPTQPPMPTQAPTVAPTQQPTAPPPPRKTVSHESSEMTTEQSTDSAMDAILVPVLASAGGSILLTFLIWRICKRRNEVALNADTDFHAMPDVRYARTA